MERNPGQELEALRADYNALKAQMKQKERLNERFFKAARLRPAQAVSKGIRNRMILDVLTLPIIWIICITTHWPLLFGVLVSLWTLIDLVATIWINRKLGMDHLLDGDTRHLCYNLLSSLLPPCLGRQYHSLHCDDLIYLHRASRPHR